MSLARATSPRPVGRLHELQGGLAARRTPQSTARGNKIKCHAREATTPFGRQRGGPVALESDQVSSGMVVDRSASWPPSPTEHEVSAHQGAPTFCHTLAGRPASTIADHEWRASLIQEIREGVREELRALGLSCENGASKLRSPTGESDRLQEAPHGEGRGEVSSVVDTKHEQLQDEHFGLPDGDGEGTRELLETCESLYRLPHLASNMDRLNKISSEFGLSYSKTQAERLVEYFPRYSNCILACGRIYAQFGISRAPVRHDYLSRVADSLWFHVATEVLIVANAIFMAYVADEEIEQIRNPSNPERFYWGEYLFFVLYSLEYMVRIARHRLYFFYGVGWPSNWLDSFVLLGQLAWFTLKGLFPNTSWLRLMRTWRLMKTARILRLMVMFNTLRTIVESIFSTMLDFVWSTVLISAFLYMVALVFVFRVVFFLESPESEEITQSQQDKLLSEFGSVQNAMLHLFMAVNGGNDWAEYYYVLEQTGRVNQVIFLSFVAFTTLALLNIILGIFVERVMKNMLVSKEEKADEHMMEEEQLQEDLIALCAEADADGSGRISLEEWKTCVQRAKMISYLDLKGFRMHDLMEYFKLCRHHSPDGLVEIKGFVRACMRLRGAASWFDQQAMAFQLLHLTQRLRAEHKETRRLIMQKCV